MTRFARIRSAFSIFDSINREYITIVLWIMLFAGLFLYMSVFGDVSLHDFWVNAFTETIGIGVTVLFIDKLLKDRERRRLRPLEIAAFNDVMHFVNGMATSWMNVYSWSGKDELLPPPEPPSMKEFLTPIYFNSIRQRLNLDAHAHVFPKRTWWEYLPQQENESRQLGEKILERHAAVLDPHAYHLVHKVLNGFLDKNVGLNMLLVLKQLGGYGNKDDWAMMPENRRNPLGRYWLVHERSLKDFADLHEWYQNNASLYRVQ